jgi:hypothetical protein
METWDKYWTQHANIYFVFRSNLFERERTARLVMYIRK